MNAVLSILAIVGALMSHFPAAPAQQGVSPALQRPNRTWPVQPW
jgi:hypothetical protein